MTYRLTGIVTDTASAAPVANAVVEAKIAPDELLPPISAAVAGPDGRYRLESIPSGVFYVRVSGHGYFAATERVELTADGTRNFTIARDPSVPDLNGSYTLTIETDDACPSAPSPLPPNLRRRTFSAQIEQVGLRLTVQATPPCCGTSVFAGSASNSRATFWLTEGPDRGFVEYEDLVEIIPSNRPPLFLGDHLVFLGTATTDFSATGLVGSLAGTITYYPADFQLWRLPSTGRCGAGRFELTRR